MKYNFSKKSSEALHGKQQKASVAFMVCLDSLIFIFLTE